MSVIDIEGIMKLLPHRYPFLLVDRVVELDTAKKTIVGIKNVTINEPFFQGHFPGLPVMPGVLQIEAMAQTGGILLMKLLDTPNLVPFFMSIDNVKFRRIVKPGDQLRIEAEITTLRAKVGRMKGVVRVDGNVASEAEMMCMIQKRDALA